MSLMNKNEEITLKLESDSNHVMVLTPRCETIQYVSTCINGDCVITQKEMCEGVFMAGIIARPTNGKIPVRILNTRDTKVTLNNCQPEVEDLSNYAFSTFQRKDITIDRVLKLISLLKLETLNKEERIAIERKCAKFSDIFHMPEDILPTTTLYEHSIPLKEHAAPVYVKLYRLPHSQKAQLKEEVQKMLDNDIIEESQSELSSPILLVPKKSDSKGDKKWRVVIDYRLLSQQVQNDRFPLPNISETLD